MKQGLVLFFTLLLGFAAAAQLKYGATVIIDQPVWENLYIAGGTVEINAAVHGDLVVAGGTIIINDSITKDIIVAGGDVMLKGHVGDDIRCAAGKLAVHNNVTGDVVITGGTVVIHSKAVIGNLLAAGGDLTVNGTVMGYAKINSGKLVLNGDVMKSLDCRGGKITINGKVRGPAVLSATENLLIGNNAFFSDTVRYWASNDVAFKHSVSDDRLIYDPSVRVNYARWYYLGFTSLVALLWYTGMVLVLLMVIQYLFTLTLKKAGDTVYGSPGKSLGWGVVYFVGVPLAVVVVFITIIGVPLGVILVAAYVLSLLLATVFTALVAVNWLNNRTGEKWSYWQLVFIALAIFVLLKIISFTPFFGWLIMLVLACMAFGAILINVPWRKAGGNEK